MYIYSTALFALTDRVPIMTPSSLAYVPSPRTSSARLANGQQICVIACLSINPVSHCIVCTVECFRESTSPGQHVMVSEMSTGTIVCLSIIQQVQNNSVVDQTDCCTFIKQPDITILKLFTFHQSLWRTFTIPHLSRQVLWFSAVISQKKLCQNICFSMSGEWGFGELFLSFFVFLYFCVFVLQ